MKQEDRPLIWDILMEKIEGSRNTIIEVMKRFDSEEEALRELERIFHSRVDEKEQPVEAFNINALSMMNTLRRQFSEEF